jgi:hypothetical protein
MACRWEQLDGSLPQLQQPTDYPRRALQTFRHAMQPVALPNMQFVYGVEYLEVASLIPWLADPFFGLPPHLHANALRAVQSSSMAFVASCASGVVAVMIGIPAIGAFGLAARYLRISYPAEPLCWLHLSCFGIPVAIYVTSRCHERPTTYS